MRPVLRVMFVSWCVALAIGAVGVGIRLITGERMAGYGSWVPWGLWVALYFHFVGIAGGAYVVGTLGALRGMPTLRERLPLILWISAAMLVTGLMAIGLDLGQMFRAPRMFLSPRFTSMMTFNSWTYVLFLGTLATIAAVLWRPSERTRGWLRPLLILGIALGVAFPSQSGVFFGVVEAKPYWSSALLPVMFLSSAVACGAAVLLFVLSFLPDTLESPPDRTMRYLRFTAIGAVAAYFVMEFGEISITLWSPAGHAREPVELILSGPFWWVFWLVHVGGGLVALALLVFGRSRAALGAGAFVVATTFVSARLNVLIPGQSFPELEGLARAFTHPKLSFYYVATPMEYMVALFIAAVGTALVYAGMRVLTGFSIQHPERAK